MKLIKTPQAIAFVMTVGIALIAFLGASNRVSDLAILESDVRPTAVPIQNNPARSKPRPPEPIQPLPCNNDRETPILSTDQLLFIGYRITEVQPTGHEAYTMVIYEHPDNSFEPSHLLIFTTNDVKGAAVYHAQVQHIQFEPYEDTDLAKAADLPILTDLNKNKYNEIHYAGYNGGNGLEAAWVCLLELNDDPGQPHVRELGYIMKDWNSNPN